MSKQIRSAAIAAAVSAAFAGAAAPAFAQATIYGAGASAVKNSVQLLVLKDYCGSATTPAITFYDGGSSSASISVLGQPGGQTFLISCTGVTGFSSTTVQIGYDTNGGSWKAFTATNTALYTAAGSQSTLNPFPVATVQTTGCAGSQVTTMKVLGSSFPITLYYGCPVRNLVPGTDVVSFGLTDVESTLFTASGDNQPLVNNSWTSGTGTPIFSNFGTGTELSGFPTPVFGVVFGIGASPKLYAAMQADQVKTGLIPSTCTVGTISSPAALCAPVISKSQYASIIGQVGGALNASLAPLFVSVVPATTTYELARRDQGSGTQASSNAYFLGDGCMTGTTPEGYFAPVLNGANVSFNQSTGGVQGKLESPTLDGGSGFAIGVLSVENESKFSANAGFLKLDGIYPSVANALTGLYGYVSQENLHGNPSATSDGKKLLADLTGSGTESALEYGLSPTVNGIVPIFSALNPNAAWGLNNNGANPVFCSGWVHF
jgi:hypothetical protein